MANASNQSGEASPQEPQPGDGWKTLAWIVAFSIAIELGLSLLLSVPAIEKSGIGRYFGYGTSTETKIRAMAADPNLPSNSVFYAGWLDPSTWPPEGEENDVAVYGMSYASRFANALRRTDRDLNVRFVGGPGAPLSHAYAAYEMDASRRTTKVVVITLLPRGLEDMASMTHDTGFSDHSQPATWPIYRRALEADGSPGIELEAWPAITTASDLRRAATEDPALWEKHLAVMEKSDPHFSRFLYASHWSERFVMGRVIRRAWAKSIEREWKQRLVTSDGNFVETEEPALLTKDLLRVFIRAVRANGEKPMVILFSQPGSRDQLQRLVGDVLEETRVDYLTSEDFCASTRDANYADLHFVPRCDELMARDLVARLRADGVLDAGSGSTSTLPMAGASPPSQR